MKHKERIQQALDLRMSSKSYSEIAKTMGCSKHTAHNLVMKGLAELEAKTKEKAEQVRQMEVMRVDAIIESLWENRGVPRASEVILKAQERRARLLGLDAPAKVAQTTPDGKDLPPALDLSKLSDEQLATLEAIYAAAAPVQAAVE